MNSDDGGAASAAAPVASVRTPSVMSAAKLLTPKGRRDQGLFLVEGPQALREALSARAVTRLFVSVDGLQRCADEVGSAQSAGVPVTVCDDAALSKISGTRTPQGAVATCVMPRHQVDLSAGGIRLVLLLDRVADPGNMGTIIRTADAAGADAVFLSRGCADVFNEKAVRSTTGSIFHVPVVVDVDASDVLTAAAHAGLRVCAADAAGASLADASIRAQLTRPTMWVFGSEAHGVAPELVAAADARVAVPMFGRAESLNVGSAAAVCLFASAFAQRA